MSSQSRSSSTKRPTGRPSGSSTNLPGFSGKRDVLGPGRPKECKQREGHPPTRKSKRKPSASGLAAAEAEAARPNKRSKSALKSGPVVGMTSVPKLKHGVSDDAAFVNSMPDPQPIKSQNLDDQSMEQPKSDDPESQEEPVRLANLTDLPAELLIEIHEMSGSTTLPYVNRLTYACLANPTTRQAVRWLHRKYPEWDSKPIQWIVGRSLEHSVCNLAVLQEIERRWREDEKASTVPGNFTSTLSIPSRVFRALVPSATRANLPVPSPDNTAVASSHPRENSVIDYLLDGRYELDRKSLKQGLRYAVFAGNLDLVQRLIELGAFAVSEDRFEIEAAARRKNLDMLKVLLETRRGIGPWRSGRGEGFPTILQPSDLDLIAKWASQEMLQYLEERWGLRPSLKSILAL